MTSRALATRYARALFDVALVEIRPGHAWANSCDAFAQMVAGHAELARVVASPAIPAKVKTAIVAQLTGQVTLESPLRKLLLMLADRDRLSLLAEMSTTAYQDAAAAAPAGRRGARHRPRRRSPRIAPTRSPAGWPRRRAGR